MELILNAASVNLVAFNRFVWSATATGEIRVDGQMFAVFIIVLAFVFLKERMTWRKWIGTALAVVGSVLVAVS